MPVINVWEKRVGSNIYPREHTKLFSKRKGYNIERRRSCRCNLFMVLVLLNIIALSGLFALLASNNFCQDLLNAVAISPSRLPDDIHQGSSVTSGDQSHTKYSSLWRK